MPARPVLVEGRSRSGAYDEATTGGGAAIISMVFLILTAAVVITTLTRLAETDRRLVKLEAPK